jgi:hypothetical protein
MQGCQAPGPGCSPGLPPGPVWWYTSDVKTPLFLILLPVLFTVMAPDVCGAQQEKKKPAASAKKKPDGTAGVKEK